MSKPVPGNQISSLSALYDCSASSADTSWVSEYFQYNGTASILDILGEFWLAISSHYLLTWMRWLYERVTEAMSCTSCQATQYDSRSEWGFIEMARLSDFLLSKQNCGDDSGGGLYKLISVSQKWSV